MRTNRMRKIIVHEHLTMDGVLQGPGGPQEDISNGFAHGGWIAPFSDPKLDEILQKQMNLPFDLLLGRKTFEIWEPYWPQHSQYWPRVMEATKYVASNTRTTSPWSLSQFLGGDIVAKIRDLKQQPGPDLHVWGSSHLLQTLMKHDLIDTYWLLIYPVTLGSGKRLFDHGTFTAAYDVTESYVSPSGVIALTYERAGDLQTGTAGG